NFCAIYFTSEEELISFWNSVPDATPAPSYETWLESFNTMAQQAEMQGFTVAKVKADIDDFLAFCREENIAPNSSAARRGYAVHKAGFDS
ncbi:hypothetical protein MPB54_005019, partial [Salmonella enterica]|nr:hypothetical protein [Salmonella enterica subsp. enterica]EIZ6014787.1 hypothetical protein [Salmonella enterica]